MHVGVFDPNSNDEVNDCAVILNRLLLSETPIGSKAPKSSSYARCGAEAPKDPISKYALADYYKPYLARLN